MVVIIIAFWSFIYHNYNQKEIACKEKSMLKMI